MRKEKLVGGEFVEDVPLVGKMMPLGLFAPDEDEDDDEEDVDEVELDVEEEVG